MPRPLRVGLLVLALGSLGGLGCGKQNTTAPLVDCGGAHLVIYASDRGQTAGQFEVWLYDFDGGGFRLLQNLNSKVVPNLNPAISGDASLVAFVSARAGGSGGDDILVYDRCIADFIGRARLNTSGDEGDPAFTYNSINLAFVRDTLGHRRIRMLDGPRDTLVALPGLEAPGFDDYAPSPNVDGSLIAFVSTRTGNPDVFVYDAAGDSVRSLPDLTSAGIDEDPWITPNGHFLAFASNRSGGGSNFDIYLYDLLTKSFVPTDSLQTASVERNPTLSADGNLIVFQSDRPGSLGKMDLWNYSRSTNVVGRSPGESSTADDVQPYLLWP